MRLVLIVFILFSLNMFIKSLLQSSIRRTSFVRSSTIMTRSIAKSSSTSSSSSFKNGKVILAMGLGLITASYHSSIALQMTSGSEGGKDLDKFSNTKLYPLGNIVEKGFLKVNDKHNISYTVYGNLFAPDT